MKIHYKIIAFLEPRLKGKWNSKTIAEMVAFFMDHRAVGIVAEKNKIGAIGLSRPVMSNRIIDGSIEDWEWNEFGDTLYVHQIAADRPDLLPLLWNLMIDRFGRRAFFAGKRHGKIRLWPFEKYELKIKELYG